MPTERKLTRNVRGGSSFNENSAPQGVVIARDFTIQSLSRWKLGTPVVLPQGIMFVTYPTLRSGRSDDTRLDQLLTWAGEDFEGVIAFDEAHAMANALGGTGTRGKVKGSEQGMAGLRLKHNLPRARVLSASATGASDIGNLGYESRLRLWGQETAFPTHESFMTEIRAGGVAAMELVARDLKAQGLYLSRSPSFAGVEYEILEHRLTEAPIGIYDAYADAGAIIHRNLDEAPEASRAEQVNDKAASLGLHTAARAQAALDAVSDGNGAFLYGLFEPSARNQIVSGCADVGC